MTDEDIYERWASRTTEAKKYNEDEFWIWASRIERYLRREQWPGLSTANLEHVVVNVLYSNTQTIVPRLYFSNPEVIVNPLTDRLIDLGPDGAPRTVDVVRNARVMKAVLQQKLKVIGFKQQQRRKIKNAYLHMGWSKIGWGTQYGMPPSPREARQKAKWKDDSAGSKPPLQRTPVTGPSVDVHPDQPWILSVHPRDVWIPPNCRSYDQMDYVVHRVFRTVEDVKSDPRYENTDDLEGTRSPERFRVDGTRRNRYGKEEEPVVELREVHYRTSDKEGNAAFKTLVIAEGHRKVLLHEDDVISNLLGNYCLWPLVFAEDPDGGYPKGDLFQAIPQQDEINRLRSHGLEVVKRQPTTYVVSGPAFDDKEMEKLMSPEPQKIVKTQAGNPGEAVMPLVASQLTQDFYAYQTRMMDDWREITGVGGNQMGASGSNTATEASIIQQNVDVRTQDKIELVKDDVIVSLGYLGILLQYFATTKEVVKIVGPDGVAWEEWDKDAIRGKYEYDIDVTTMLAPNQAVKKKLALDLFNIAVMQPSVFNVTEMAKGLLKTYQDVYPDPSKLLRENEEPSQAEEMLSLVNGKDVPTQPWYNHPAHMQTLQAFVQSPAFGLFPPPVQQLILKHGATHQQFMRQAMGQQGANPGQGQGAIPAMMATKTPTESSIAAGAVGGRPMGVP